MGLNGWASSLSSQDGGKTKIGGAVFYCAVCSCLLCSICSYQRLTVVILELILAPSLIKCNLFLSSDFASRPFDYDQV